MFCTGSFRANFFLKQFFVKSKIADSKMQVQDFLKVIVFLIAAHYIAYSKKVTALYRNTYENIRQFKLLH